MRHPAGTLLLAVIAATILAALFATCAGCGSTWRTDPYPRQAQAQDVVWGLYEGRLRPPAVIWVVGGFDCHYLDQTSFDGWRCDEDGQYMCCVGMAYVDSWSVLVAHPRDYSYSDAAETLEHEYWHAVLYQRTGDADPDHHDPGFGAEYGHPAGGAVDQARDALRQAGL